MLKKYQLFNHLFEILNCLEIRKEIKIYITASWLFIYEFLLEFSTTNLWSIRSYFLISKQFNISNIWFKTDIFLNNLKISFFNLNDIENIFCFLVWYIYVELKSMHSFLLKSVLKRLYQRSIDLYIFWTPCMIRISKICKGL